MTVSQLLSSLDSRELTEWMAYYHVESEDERQRALEIKAANAMQARTRRHR